MARIIRLNDASKEIILMAIDSGPSEDGFYYIDGTDDVSYTENAINDLLKQSNDLQEGEDKAMAMNNTFFPQCERGELNKGDY